MSHNAKLFIIIISLVSVCINSRSDSVSFSLKQENSHIYLIRGKKRLLILEKGKWIADKHRKTTSRLPGGYRVIWPSQDTQYLLNNRKREVIIQKDGKPYATIWLQELLEKWLENDDLWGGHQAANRLRYMHRSAGGISGIITNAMPQGQTLIALLSWFAVGPSGMPIMAQHLIRFQVKPKPSIKPLRLLNDIPSGWLYSLSSNPVPRLFPYKDRLLLYTKPGETTGYAGDKPQPSSELLEITSEGKTIRAYSRMPPQRYPIGLLDGRWLILGEIGDKIDRPLWIYDLSLKKPVSLPGDWKGYSDPGDVFVPDSGRQILIRIGFQNGRSARTYLVTVPGGRKISLSGPTDSPDYYLWQDTAILYSSGTVFIYGASTGKLMQKMKVPL